MRLAVFVEYLPPKLGSDRRIFEIMRRITETNEIHFIVLPPFRVLSGKLPLAEGKFRLHLQKEDSAEKANGIAAHFCRIPNSTLRLWRTSQKLAFLATLILLFPRILPAVKKMNPEIVVLNYPSAYTGLLGLVIGKILGRKVLLDFNDLIAQYTADFLDLRRNGLMAALLINIQDFIAKNSDKIVATTDFIKQYTRSLGVEGKRVSVVPNGVDTEVFDSKNFFIHSKTDINEKGKMRCVYCGRLESWAGVNIITKLGDIFWQKHPEVQFLIVGQGREKVTKRQNIMMMKEVLYEDVPGILAAANVILVPFPRNIVSHAASPLKLFEGMSMGKAVVASNLEGIREVVVDFENGMLADPDDVEEWFEDVEYLLKNKSAAAEIGRKARQTVKEEYDWNHIAERFEKVLNDQTLAGIR